MRCSEDVECGNDLKWMPRGGLMVRRSDEKELMEGKAAKVPVYIVDSDEFRYCSSD